MSSRSEGHERLVETIQKRVGGTERQAKKMPVGNLAAAIDAETGVGMRDMVSRRPHEELRRARGTPVSLAKET